MSYLSTGVDVDPSAGAGPNIDGDPTIALLAQLNRFAGKDLVPAAGAAPRHYVTGTFPLNVSAYNDRAAFAAVTILIDRYQYAPSTGYDKGSADWATSGLADPMGFVAKNLTMIVPIIALYGDKLGLAPAEAGITSRDPRLVPDIPWGTLAVIAVGALVISKLRKKGRR